MIQAYDWLMNSSGAVPAWRAFDYSCSSFSFNLHLHSLISTRLSIEGYEIFVENKRIKGSSLSQSESDLLPIRCSDVTD